MTGAGQEIGSVTPPSVSRANRSRSANFRGTRAINVKSPMAITLVVLFLAASGGILYKFSGRFSGNSPKARNSKFAEEARRGLDAFRRADYDQAIVAFDELIRLDPNHSEAHRWRGDALLNKHEFDKALSEYDEAIRLDPKNGMAYCGRGAASTGKGEFDKAIPSFEEAIRLDPRIASMPFYKRCRAVAESLLPPNPQNPKFPEVAGRGLDAFEKADYDQAIVAFNELIRLDPNHSEAHRWRGDALLNSTSSTRRCPNTTKRSGSIRKMAWLTVVVAPPGPGKGNSIKRSPPSRKRSGSIRGLPTCRSTNATGQWPRPHGPRASR